MIKTLLIENFRSIERLEITFESINALVGANNAGKSNIMRALNLVLGSTYPSIRSFDQHDFHDYNKANKIVIAPVFTAPLTSNRSVWGFRLTFDGNDCDFFATAKDGTILTYSSGRETRVSNEMKDEVTLMYLGLDREASEQVKSTQWTLYGKLLKHIERKIPVAEKDKFIDDIKISYDSNIAKNILSLEETLKDHIKKQTGLQLHLRMKLFNTLDTIKNLRPYLSEDPSSVEFDAEDMGAGTQSALAIAIARAYGKFIKQPLVLAIEEPELYLHPHGCRRFYKTLRELTVDGIQVIYTTHDRCFVDISNFQELHHIKKQDGKTLINSGINGITTPHHQLSTVSKFDDNINEVFFSNHAILVEAGPDKIACHTALETLGLDLDKESISIVDCAGNSNIKPIAEILILLNIPTYALVDEDPGNPKTAGIIANLKSCLGADNVFLQSPKLEDMFGLSKKPTRAESITFFPTWFVNNIPQDVYHQLKERISL